MRRLLILLLLCAHIVSGQVSTTGQYDLVIGTYTSKDKENGIHVYSFNSKTGDVSFKTKTTGIENPAYLAVSKDKKNVYVASEVGNGNGSVYSYAFDPAAGTLTFLNKVSSGGDGPCYVSVDDSKKHVFAGNYTGGSLMATTVKPDGSLNESIQSIQHEGSSIVKGRQDKPHVHSTIVSPDGHYLLVPDLGTDKVNIYKIEDKKEPLSAGAQPFAELKPGTGPRHLTFHTSGKYAYLVQELEAMVTAFSYKDGKLEAIQSITMIADGFKDKVSAADIHCSPDGKFLYASNRGDANEIVIYSIARDGKLTLAGRQSTVGKTPRNFAIDPSGSYLLVANQNTDNIIIFKRDAATGLLTDTGKKIDVSMPVCLKFVPL